MARSSSGWGWTEERMRRRSGATLWTVPSGGKSRRGILFANG